MKRYWFSHKIAENIFPQLVQAYHRKEGVFGLEGLFPEMPLPSGMEFGGYEHANWWFFTTMMDHSVKSMLHYQRSRQLYEAISKDGLPNIFDPREVIALDVRVVYDTLYRMCFGANNHPQRLKTNAERLVSEYDGNPLHIFKDIREIQKAKEMLMTFERFSDGTAGLYLTFLLQYGLVTHFDNPQDILVKVDHHDIRGLHCLGVLRLGEGEISDGEIAVPAACFMKEKCKELGLPILDLDDALWALGVHGCFYRNPERCEILCPFDKVCDKENMLGSYYKDGTMREGVFWSGRNTRNTQERLSVDGSLLAPIKVIRPAISLSILHKKSDDSTQLGLF